MAIERLPSRDSLQRGEYRRVEREAWHKLARYLLHDEAAQFDYTAVGAPFIVGSPLHISVSHSADLVAVILSKVRCAVDIESLTRNFERVASRYISPRESLLQEDIESLRPKLWSIKESLYKYGGVEGLDLLSDIEIIRLEGESFEALTKTEQEPIVGSVVELFSHTLAYVG